MFVWMAFDVAYIIVNISLEIVDLSFTLSNDNNTSQATSMNVLVLDDKVLKDSPHKWSVFFIINTFILIHVIISQRFIEK